MASLRNSVLFAYASSQLLDKNQNTRPFSHFAKAALGGHVSSAAILGFCFEFGLSGISVNYQVCERWYTSAARRGSGLAAARLAFLKTHGRRNLKINQADAESWRQLCNKKGEQELRWLIVAAEAGLAAAQFSLALCYYNGIALPEDDSLAFQWCEKAAHQGLAGAQNVLGNLYIEGSGCEINHSLGLSWYIKAAEQRESAAIYNIGTLFERGLAVEEDQFQAFDWYIRAAAYGSVNAQNVLGIFYEQGTAISQNKFEAVSYYTKAAMAGHPHAQYNLGRCFHDGFGCEKNDMLAVGWFDLAAQQDHVLSLLSVAIAHELGIGTPIDKARSLQYFRRAAARDSEEAKRRLSEVVALHMLVPARTILGPRAQSSESKIQELPMEIVEQILASLDPDNILSKSQRRAVLNYAMNSKTLVKGPMFSRQRFLDRVGIQMIEKLCKCKTCKSIKHMMAALEPREYIPVAVVGSSVSSETLSVGEDELADISFSSLSSATLSVSEEVVDSDEESAVLTDEPSFSSLDTII
ncbi:hypothetical protein BJ742DRAFT_773684 [Cladochytrium replicatum]|nr:hypothetical protein BJ742DRAFT_773684 [Cladochytrium replicatum]